MTARGTEVKPRWFRHYWRPWGHVIGHHDFCFLQCGDRFLEVTRHYYGTGKSRRVKHYCCTDLPGGYNSKNWWRKTWKDMTAALAETFGPITLRE